MSTDPDYRLHRQMRWDTLPDGRLEFAVPHGGHRLRLPRTVAQRLLTAHERDAARPIAAWRAELGELAEALLRHHLLLPAHFGAAIERGLCEQPGPTAGRPLRPGQLDDLTRGDTVILHAPIQTTVGGEVDVRSGGKMVRRQLALSLPEASHWDDGGRIVDLDFGQSLPCADWRLFDLGDVVHSPVADTAADVGERLSYLCERIASRGAVPVVLGGDHAQAYYTIGALARTHPRLGILQIDAHPDLYLAGGPADAQLHHANVMRWVREFPHVDRIWQVGVRDAHVEPPAAAGGPEASSGKVLRYSCLEAETRGYDRLLAALDPALPWFLSFDIDAMAGLAPPDTATPVLGGLSLYPLLDFLDRFFARCQLAGLEFVEIGSHAGGAHGGAAIAARMLNRFLFNHFGASTAPARRSSPIAGPTEPCHA